MLKDEVEHYSSTVGKDCFWWCFR